MSKVLLVSDFKTKAWDFPCGKIKKGEHGTYAAKREVMEETSYNIEGKIDENLFIEVKRDQAQVKLYIVVGVADNFEFRPTTRKEIQNVTWHEVHSLPTTYRAAKIDADGAFFRIFPALTKLCVWIESKRRAFKPRSPSSPISSSHDQQQTQPTQPRAYYRAQGSTKSEPQDQIQTSLPKYSCHPALEEEEIATHDHGHNQHHYQRSSLSKWGY